MIQDEADIVYTIGALLRAAETVNARYGGALGSFLLENLHIGIDTSWAGDFGCGGHACALSALAARRCSFRLCPIYRQGIYVEDFAGHPGPAWGIGDVARRIRAGKILPLRAPR